MDPLSDILGGLRLSGALFLHGRFDGDWCIDSPNGDALAARLGHRPGPVRLFHFVAEGECQVHRPGDSPKLLVAGDLVMFPHGHGHRIGSRLDRPPLDAVAVIDRLRRAPLVVDRAGPQRGVQPSVTLVCGWIACGGGLRHPLFEALPAMLQLNLRAAGTAAWLEPALHALVQPSVPATGRDAVAARLAEALFVDVLSRHLADLTPASESPSKWLSALADPVVGQALAALHADPARAWTLDGLAHVVGSSRSVLGERFGRLLGQSPMRYLGHWRLQRAAELLDEGNAPLLRIAEAVGYGTEAAFSRAFHRRFGAPPSVWRRRQGGANEVAGREPPVLRD